MKKYLEFLPSYILNDLIKQQVLFGLAFVVPTSAALTLAFMYHLISLFWLGWAAFIAFIILHRQLSSVRKFVLITHFLVEEQKHIEHLCALDEGFEEFWKKHEFGFTEEDARKIATVLKRKHGTSNKEDAD